MSDLGRSLLACYSSAVVVSGWRRRTYDVLRGDSCPGMITTGTISYHRQLTNIVRSCLGMITEHNRHRRIKPLHQAPSTMDSGWIPGATASGSIDGPTSLFFMVSGGAARSTGGESTPSRPARFMWGTGTPICATAPASMCTRAVRSTTAPGTCPRNFTPPFTPPPRITQTGSNK